MHNDKIIVLRNRLNFMASKMSEVILKIDKWQESTCLAFSVKLYFDNQIAEGVFFIEDFQLIKAKGMMESNMDFSQALKK